MVFLEGFEISSGLQVSAVLVAVSFGIPVLSALDPSNLPLTGSVSVTMVGREFGRFSSSASVFIQGTRCEASIWIVNSAIVCKAASGSGFQSIASISVGQRFSTITQFSSFDAPVVIVAANGSTNTPSSGGVSLSIIGSSFGYTQTSASARFGFTTCERSLWRSQTLMICKSPSGRTSRSALVASVSSSAGSVTLLLSYNTPAAVRSLSRSPATGSMFVAIVGRHFATRRQSPAVRITASSCEVSQWASDSCISVMFVSGVGVTLPVSVTASSTMGSASFAASYAVPTLTSWTPACAATTAASSITVSGTLFGRLSFSQRLRLRQTASATTIWRSDSSIFNLVPAGFSRNAVLIVSAGLNAGSTSTQFFYAANVISGATNLNIPTTGSSSITMFGQGLGIALPTVEARVGGTACKSSVWSSESSMFCKANNGGSIFRDVFVSIEGRNDRMFLMFSYNTPRLVALAPFVGVPFGGGIIALSGSGFSTASNQFITLQIGSTQASAIQWISDSSVVGTTRGGSGVGLDVKFSATGQLAPDILKYSYHTPTISALQTYGCPPTLLNCPSITIYGHNFGQVPGDDVRVLLGGNSVHNSTKVSDSSITVSIRPGAGSALTVTVSSSSQQTTLSPAFSYDAPIPMNVSVYNSPPSGSQPVQISGANFGILNLTPQIGTGNTGAMSTSWMSDTIVRAKLAAGMGEGLPVRVSVSTQSSMTLAFTYNKLIASSVKNTNAPSSGGVMLTVLGLSFSVVAYSPLAKVSSLVHQISGKTSCETSIWMADSSILCKVPAAACFLSNAVLTLNVASALVSSSVTYNVMSILGVLPLIPASGSAMLTASGSNFNPYDVSPVFRAVPTSCQATLWISDSLALCKSPAGPSTSGFAVASIAGRTGTSLTRFSFADPRVSSIDPMGVPPSGSVIVSVFGSVIGNRGISPTTKFGVSLAPSSVWMSDTAVVMKAPSGASQGIAVWISVVRRVGSMSQILSFAPPSPRGTLLANAATSAGTLLVVVGIDFGGVSASSGVRITGTSALRSLWASLSSISAKVPSGRAASTLSVSTGLQWGSVSSGLTFNMPSISSAMIANAPQSGGTLVTVLGQGFGARALSDAIIVGSTRCESSVWNSESAFRCKMSFGQHKLSGILLEYSESTQIRRSSSSTFALSYDVSVVLHIVGNSNAPTTGSSQFVVAGRSLNAASASMSFGRSSCEVSIWFSASAVRCKISAGSAMRHHIRVSAAGASGSISAVLSYNIPSLSSTSSTNAPSTGSISVTIVGQQFTLTFQSVTARVGFSLSLSTIWVSDSTVQSLTGSSVFISSSVQVSAASAGLFSFAFSTDTPLVSSVSVVSFPLTGSSMTIVHGRILGTSAMSPAATVGHSISMNSRWTSDSALAIKTVSSVGILMPVVVSSFGTTGSLSAIISFSSPVVMSVVSGMSPSTGSQQCTLVGQLASQAFDSSVSSRISGSSTLSTRWLSSSAVIVKVVSGAGVLLTAIVSVNRINTFSNAFSFCISSADSCAVPVSSVVLTNSPSSGSVLVTIIANSFGIAAFSVRSRAGHTASTAAIWTSDSSLASKSARGTGFSLSARASVNQASNISSLSLALSYDAPSVTSERDRSLIVQASTGSMSITMQGSSFGTTFVSQGARVGGTAARPVRWISDSSIVSKVSSGVSSRLGIVATSAILAGSLTAINYFDPPGIHLQDIGPC